MTILSTFGGTSGIDTGDIGHSLRFRGAQYLNRTFGANTGSPFTASLWLKRGSLATRQFFFAATNGTNNSGIGFDATDHLIVVNNSGSDNVSTAVFRDPTAPLHIVFQSNGTTVTVLVNNLQVLQFSASLVFFNTNVSHTIGRLGVSAIYFDGYISRVAFVSNSIEPPSSFGYLNTEINEWVSKSQSAVKAVVDAGGTNSFMLDFDNATSLTTLGYDKSSKGNNWTLNNFSLTAGATYDWMLDVPGNSFATLNPIYPSAANITNGNLSSGTTAARGTMNSTAINSQWFVTAGGSAVTAGVIDDSGTTNTTSVTANKVFAFKMTTAGALSYKNVTDAGSWTSIATGLTGNRWPYSVTQAASWNFGQQPLPEALDTGFKALNQANLETPAILNPEEHHNVYTVTKSGSTNFTLDWDGSVYDTYFEIKRRDAAGDWYTVDGLRGYDKILKSNSTAAEITDANVIGVSGTTCTLKSTLPDGTYVIAAWKAGLTASRQTNTDGSITSTVSRNVTSGFAIVTYTGTGVNATVGHGLGNAPKLVTVFRRLGGYSWTIQHASVAVGSVLFGEATSAATARAIAFNSTYPASTVFSVGTDIGTNGSTHAIVAYVHAEIPGYSKFGSYTGNASADGPYVDVGFKAKWLRQKSSTAVENWVIWDSARDPNNVCSKYLYISTAAESSTGVWDIDAMGVKLSASSATFSQANTSGQTYIYSAYADVAGKFSLSR